MKKCKVLGCSGKCYSRGLCQAHYLRWLKHGNVLAYVPLRITKPRGVNRDEF
jgi:hypothetical protein